MISEVIGPSLEDFPIFDVLFSTIPWFFGHPFRPIPIFPLEFSLVLIGNPSIFLESNDPLHNADAFVSAPLFTLDLAVLLLVLPNPLLFFDHRKLPTWPRLTLPDMK